MTTCSLLQFAAAFAGAAELRATVLDHTGQPLAGAAVVLEPVGFKAPAQRTKGNASMDQRSLRFVPELLVVQTGMQVSFPNSDQVLHQVYSFSAAKKFQLALYAGKAYPPVQFDKPGLVTLGCNIHDSMIGYILVVDTPWYAISDSRGNVELQGLPDGDYELLLWHPHQKDKRTESRQRLRLGDASTGPRELTLNAALRTPPQPHGTDKSWEDY